VANLNDTERVALLAQRLGLPDGSLPEPLALEALRHGAADPAGAAGDERAHPGFIARALRRFTNS
jgi:hypothetical protein